MSVSPQTTIIPAKLSKSLISSDTQFKFKFPLLSQKYLLTVGLIQDPNKVYTLHWLVCPKSLIKNCPPSPSECHLFVEETGSVVL